MTFPIAPGNPNFEDLPLHEIEDHDERALKRLLTQFQEKPVLAALIRVLIEPFQELEGVFWDLKLKRTLDGAVGAQLDLLGRVLDEPRGPLSDDDYRAVLRIKVLVLKSSGTATELMTICDRMLQGLTPYEFTELFPAAIEVQLDDNPFFAAALLLKFLRKAKSAGVGLNMIQPSSFPAGTFRYGGLPETTDVLRGYGDGFYAGLVL